MSKCGSVAGFRTSVHMHGVPEGDGRWWWALNGCTNQPEGGPLGSVAGQTAPGTGMAGTDKQGPNQWTCLEMRGGCVCMEKLPRELERGGGGPNNGTSS